LKNRCRTHRFAILAILVFQVKFNVEFTSYIPSLLCVLFFFVIPFSTDIVHGKAVQFLLLHEDLSLQYVIPAVSL